MNIDWIEGATHYGIGDDCPVFFRNIIKGESYEFKNVYSSGIMADWLECTGYIDIQNGLIERPKKQEAWNGDGLPPIGMVCEYQTWINREWKQTKILAHHLGFAVHSWSVDGDDMEVDAAPPQDFRSVRAPEQLEEEERKSQLEVMHKIYMKGASEHKGGLAALYDAGYKLAK